MELEREWNTSLQDFGKLHGAIAEAHEPPTKRTASPRLPERCVRGVFADSLSSDCPQRQG
eukprot:79574-Amorphochlora_amoeboformis.AAC.1